MIIKLITIAMFPVRIKSGHITVLMTFPDDMMPIITTLHEEGYDLTVITNKTNNHLLQNLAHTTVINSNQSHVLQQVKALKEAKVVIIDNYYLLLGGFRKNKDQTIIQTWHASGALKLFGLADHQVDNNNKKIVAQYKKVYNATDYYLIGSDNMSQCFATAYATNEHQMLKYGLPRLQQYFITDMKQLKKKLKERYHINKKLVVYLPTYRENTDNKTLDKAYFEQQLPNYTLISKYHPSVKTNDNSLITTPELLIMADLIISDYSSIPIEASLINTPTIFFVYDEEEYEKTRGLNSYYYQIPAAYKVKSEGELIALIRESHTAFLPIFKDWHQYNDENSMTKLIKFIESVMKNK
ncbi:CDP-glycerol: N-acetyl-beta-D-mannosaminyl-1,4-N-acetyl-D- glucosaminyldiphosphoundecaprenyl [Staphylococcus simiae CCM 7213 = CCUG 51256]|uniref:CDP-glycerol: N-acetyl-beta-D-mannosaminyl-1,4-N-acetyl-D-glucosaminyldiphosphoundecaprenyl n=1 Tax=Staphylococcus simiae CCM 7213 = CCUG 51256 TaxID=911238 RepID=G5JM60_9STAP|nr:teichoic acid glycerol-phosphate primase TarB [Staphylococcus simiae]EHJ06707.1 CDP-glycerol: N-acetyl-beta-D-mannosaminyl-1,4-N-acetyl-D- glucosaminyldiphosphoundecaprenyl [Staphylococcus simiae CCM 7213 = CCUG 51256]SNV63219.1 CDP-glycerol: N-acetyl-beta-D-mannosaminyl-1,4-N-acetyl-D-glucosaminyldiphosphoUDP glycerophosphotransferase [Staphylococcus simiae]